MTSEPPIPYEKAIGAFNDSERPGGPTMRAPRAIDITTKGINEAGDLVVNVRLRRRSWYAVRLFYRSARSHGAGRLHAFTLAARLALTPTEVAE